MVESLKSRILEHVKSEQYRPVKPRVIAKQLKLPSEQHKALKLAIKRLAKAGKVSYGAGHLVRAPKKAAVQGPMSNVERQRSEVGGQRSEVGRSSLPARENKNILIGTFRRTSKGFGFVRPKGSKRGDRSGVRMTEHAEHAALFVQAVLFKVDALEGVPEAVGLIHHLSLSVPGGA